MARRRLRHVPEDRTSTLYGAHAPASKSWIRPLGMALLFIYGLASLAHGHVWNMTRVRVSFSDPRHCEVQLEIDLTRTLGSPETYYAFTQLTYPEQRRQLEPVFAKLWPRFHFKVGELPVSATLQEVRLPAGPRGDFGYIGIGKMTSFDILVTLPDSSEAFWFEPEGDLLIEYPLAVTYEIPAQGITMTRWLDIPTASRRFDFHAKLDLLAQSEKTNSAAETKLDLSETEAKAVSIALTMGRYLHLGFRHIFPTGVDHILFVIGLFFLGISWRKLLTQTTVFTIAHTTTLGLSACGILSLPPWFVEPAIAVSIAFVAIENLVRPRLTAGRLVVVFMFGLIHGLGFAGSLSEIGLPKQEFWLALLSFNFGVDFGQLFILALCFLTVGWFRDRTWFRPRIVAPVCCMVAAIGLIWAARRIVHYANIG